MFALSPPAPLSLEFDKKSYSFKEYIAFSQLSPLQHFWLALCPQQLTGAFLAHVCSNTTVLAP